MLSSIFKVLRNSGAKVIAAKEGFLFLFIYLFIYWPPRYVGS